MLRADLNALQNLALPIPLHAVAHHPHVTSTSSYLVLHAPSTSSRGARARTAPLIYHLDLPTLQLLPLDSVLPPTEMDETRLGKRAAVFRDELKLVPLARPAVKKAKMQANGGGDIAADAMEEDEDDLYGGSAREETKANGVNGTSEAAPGGEVEKDRIVRRQDMGGDAQDRWEWLAEVDAKGDFKVRFRRHRTRAATHADPASPRRSASCLPSPRSLLPPPSPCFPRSSKTASRTA